MKSLALMELLDYNDEEAQHWHRWLEKQPSSVLDLLIEIYGKTARDLLLHIFAVELRYAQRLAGQAVTPYEELPKGSLDELFGIGGKAKGMLKNYLRSASDEDMNATITFTTLSAGEQSASKRKVIIHALVHGLRHWAQLATEMRQRGYKTDWHHDFLFCRAMK